MPAELLSISEKAMMRERGARYEGMNAMGDDVRAYLENRVVSAHRTGAIAELTKWIRRNRGVAATPLVALGVASTALVVVSLLNIDLTRAKNETDQALVEKNDALSEKIKSLRQSQSLVLAGESFKILEGNPGSALLLALEASELASGLAVNEAILKALERTRELVTYPDHCRKLSNDNFLAMNQAGTILAGATETHEVYLADVATGRRTAVCVGHGGAINHLAFNPAGDRLLSASADETVRIWEVSTGRLLKVLPGHDSGAASAIFHPRKNLVASLSKSGLDRLWNLPDPKGEPTTWRANEKVKGKVIRFSPEGQNILVGCDDGTAWLVDHSTLSNPIELGPHRGGVPVVGFSSTGQFFTVALAKLKGVRGTTIETDCHLWSADGELLFKLSSEESLVTAAAFSGDGCTIVTGAKDGSVRAWNTETGELIALVQESASGSRVTAIETNADGSLVAIGGTSEVVMRDVRRDGSRSVIRARFQGHSKWVKALRFGPGEEWILTSAQDNTMRRWRVHDRSALPTLASAGPVPKIEFQAEGVGLLTQSDDGKELALWEVPEGKRKRSFSVNSPVLRSSLSHDGKHLLALHEDGTIS